MKQNTKLQFPDCTISFLNKLAKNNNREWFEANRDLYESNFLQPAEEFVTELGPKLQKLHTDLIAFPKIDKSIFRLHRDVRFSKDKSPYKKNLAILIWEGERKKLECPGFYIHVEPKLFFIGSGVYEFSKETIKIFREAVCDPVKGKKLHQIVTKFNKGGKYLIGGKKFKKIPKDFNINSP